MKSIKGEGAAICPNGCPSFEAEFWTLICPEADLELKDALLGGEINLARCPHCGEFFYHDRTIIYFSPENRFLALVSPKADSKDFSKTKVKMQKDFETLKNNLTSLQIDYEPLYLEGLEQLKTEVEKEEILLLQSEVISALAAQKGYTSKTLDRAAARKKNYPFFIPADGEYTSPNVLAAAQDIFKENPTLLLLENLIKDIKAKIPLPK